VRMKQNDSINNDLPDLSLNAGNATICDVCDCQSFTVIVISMRSVQPYIV
jgi:hypothetical protein